MRCIHCNRPMKEPAVTIKSLAGPIYWGPKCAERAGIRMESRSKGRTANPQRATDHSAQADWIDNLNTPQPELIGPA